MAGRPSNDAPKWTADTRAAIIASLHFGASRSNAARAAGVDPTTLSRWMKKGESSTGEFGKFLRDVERAEAECVLKLQRTVYDKALDNGELGLRLASRLDGRWAPPQPAREAVAQPIMIELRLSDGAPLPALPSSVIEIGEPDSSSDSA